MFGKSGGAEGSLKIVHVVPHVDKEAAGPSYSVPRLCEALAARGHDVELSCQADGGELAGVRVRVYAQWRLFARFAVSPRHARALWRAAREVDIVHNHSLWSFVNVAVGWVATGRKAKLVTSPRGTLSNWALSRRSVLKTLLWPFQRRALARADLLHATSEEELRDIRRNGFAAPVAVIPNGIDIPPERAVRPAHERKTLLFLGRLHPTKCVDRLLEAWSRIEAEFPTWDFRIVGTGEAGYVSELHSVAEQLRLQRVHFGGPLYGEHKARAYRGADLYVLASHSENFGMTVAEALAHECPVIVSKGAPWEQVVSERCGWWVDNDVDSLASGLREAMSRPAEDLRQMGKNGRAWMEREFSWRLVAERMEQAYRWVLDGGDTAAKPGWVR